MGKYIFQIMKLLISMVLQCCIIFSCVIFYTDNFVIEMVGLLAIILGEIGIYLLCTLKPLENRKKNIVYIIVYVSVHIVLFSILIYINLTQPFPMKN